MWTNFIGLLALAPPGTAVNDVWLLHFLLISFYFNIACFAEQVFVNFAIQVRAAGIMTTEYPELELQASFALFSALRLFPAASRVPYLCCPCRFQCSVWCTEYERQHGITRDQRPLFEMMRTTRLPMTLPMPMSREQTYESTTTTSSAADGIEEPDDEEPAMPAENSPSAPSAASQAPFAKTKKHKLGRFSLRRTVTTKMTKQPATDVEAGGEANTPKEPGATRSSVSHSTTARMSAAKVILDVDGDGKVSAMEAICCCILRRLSNPGLATRSAPRSLLVLSSLRSDMCDFRALAWEDCIFKRHFKYPVLRFFARCRYADHYMRVILPLVYIPWVVSMFGHVRGRAGAEYFEKLALARSRCP